MQAQNPCESNRYIEEVFSNYTLQSGIYFGSADPYGLVSNQDLYLDIYMPAGDTLSKRPVIVHKFGGGYAIGWRSEPNIPAFAEEYTKRGYVFISIDYRLGFNPLESASAERAVYRGIQDLRAALRYIAQNANTYGIDTSHIFLTGTSAGSISALGQTYMNETDRPNSTFGTFLEPADLGCSNCSGNNYFNQQEVKIHGIINNWGAVLDTSLIDIITDPADNVPVISFHGTNDNAVKYVEGPPFSVPYFPNMQGSYLLHQRLNHQGIINELHPLVGFGHEPQLLNPELTDTIVKYGTHFLYKIMQGEDENILGDSLVCINEIAHYSIPYTLGNSYCWEVIGGNIIAQNENMVTIQWVNAGNQLLSVTSLNEITVSKKTILNVTVAQAFAAQINYSSYDGLFQFYGNYIPNASYTWQFGDNMNGNGITISHQYTDTGLYEVQMTIDNNFCQITDTIMIISDLCPIAQFNYSVNESNLILENTALYYENIYWNFGDGQNSNTDTNFHQYLIEGSYLVQQVVYNNFCIDTFETQIVVDFCSNANFDYTTSGLTVFFTNQSFQNTANFWNFGDGTTNGTFSPIHQYAQAGEYWVQLIVFDEDLCSDTVMQKIIVTEKIDTNTAINHIEKQTILVYPTVTKDFVSISNLTKNSIYYIINLEGKVMKSQMLEATQNQSISLNDLANGFYYLHILSENKSFAFKIIKQ